MSYKADELISFLQNEVARFEEFKKQKVLGPAGQKRIDIYNEIIKRLKDDV